jgi:ABC-type phosphate transport system substrate-binding protein
MAAANRIFLTLLLIVSVPTTLTSAAAPQSLMVVAHQDTPPLNEDILQKIYLGKVVEVDGRPVIPVNLAKGSALRKAFIEQFVGQDDEKFIAYWLVRQYIGKGSPPREFASIEQQLEFVRTTPGAVGYVSDSAQIKQGVRVLLRKP